MYEDIAKKSIYLFNEYNQRKSIEKKLQLKQQEEKRLNLFILDNLPGLVCVLNENLELIKWNHFFAAHVEKEHLELEKVQFQEFFVLEEQLKIKNAFASLDLLKNDSAHITAELFTNKQEKIPLFLSIITYSSSQPPYFICTGLDISILKNIERNMRKKLQRLVTGR